MSLHTPSNSTEVEMLTVGDAADIARALEKFGARPTTVAQAMSSFVFGKIPGARVSRVVNEDGMVVYNIGNSKLPEAPLQISERLGTVQNRFAKVMAANESRLKLAA